jgi:uncharacterized membrane protein YedE/YeeE
VIEPEKGKPYWNPYVAGAVLGLFVTAAFVAGHYFGASRVFATLARWLRGDDVTLNHWMTYELLGMAGGAFVGAMIARRFKVQWTRGPRLGGRARLLAALVGGALVMIGSRFAAGCTSGLALTGGVRMSAGAYVFMGAMFAIGFLAAAVGRRLWT